MNSKQFCCFDIGSFIVYSSYSYILLVLKLIIKTIGNDMVDIKLERGGVWENADKIIMWSINLTL